MNHPVVALLLFLILLVVMPVWGWMDMRRLKRDGSGISLTRSYITTVATMWLLAALSAVLIQAPTLWHPPVGLAAGMKLDLIPRSAVIGVCIGMLVGLIGPVVIAARKPESTEQMLNPIRFLLPVTTLQRWLFALMCVTAGVCEEWIYRGFVLHFLVAKLPGVNGWWIVLMAAALFGIAHVYQGRAGTILTGVLGFVFALLYICVGSLLLPMIFHALLDLRIFLLLPKGRAVPV